MCERTKEEIEEQIDLSMEFPDKFHGMTYADGVKYALQWVLGEMDEKPMEG